MAGTRVNSHSGSRVPNGHNSDVVQEPRNTHFRPKVGLAMITTTARSGVLRATAWSLGFAVLWAIVALARPDSTFHLAPLLVAGVAPVVVAFDSTAQATKRTVSITAALSLSLALVAILILSAAGRLDGGVLEPFSDPVVESIAGALAGGLLGWLIGMWRVG
jgi:hypothetical protein